MRSDSHSKATKRHQGQLSNLSANPGWMPIHYEFHVHGTGSNYEIGRSNIWIDHVKRRVPLVGIAKAPVTNIDHPDIRTPSDHVKNIRDVLNPPVADLAAIFNVTRQAIYKWISGASTPEDAKLDQICKLSELADQFREQGVSRADLLIRTKAFGGRSLLDLIKTGENSDKHVVALIDEAKAIESSYEKSGLATSKSKPTSDWQSSVSIPGSFERE